MSSEHGVALGRNDRTGVDLLREVGLHAVPFGCFSSLCDDFVGDEYCQFYTPEELAALADRIVKDRAPHYSINVEKPAAKTGGFFRRLWTLLIG